MIDLIETRKTRGSRFDKLDKIYFKVEKRLDLLWLDQK